MKVNLIMEKRDHDSRNESKKPKPNLSHGCGRSVPPLFV